MKIETDISIVKSNIQSLLSSLTKGQTFAGRIIYSENQSLQIVTINGEVIRAQIEGTIDFQMQKMLLFEIVENRQNEIVIRLAIPEKNKKKSGDVFRNIAASLKIPQTAENMKTLEKIGNGTCKNFLDLMELLQDESLQEFKRAIEKFFITPSSLFSFLTKGKEESIAELIDCYAKIYRELERGSNSLSQGNVIIKNLLNSLLLQINHPFPLMYIPILLSNQEKYYVGEVWIEKNAKEDLPSTYVAHISIEVEWLGYIESHITSKGNNLSILFLCNKELIPFLTASLSSFTEMLKSNGYQHISVKAEELHKAMSFLDLYQKFSQDIPIIDMKL